MFLYYELNKHKNQNKSAEFLCKGEQNLQKEKRI